MTRIAAVTTTIGGTGVGDRALRMPPLETVDLPRGIHLLCNIQVSAREQVIMDKDRIAGAAKGIRGSITELTLSLGKTIDDAKLVRPAFERKQGEPMTDFADSMVTFPIAGGIFGVGRLATSLKTLQSVGHIGPWHVGHWVDFTHTAIRIRFDSVVDAQVATRECVR